MYEIIERLFTPWLNRRGVIWKNRIFVFFGSNFMKTTLSVKKLLSPTMAEYSRERKKGS